MRTSGIPVSWLEDVMVDRFVNHADLGVHLQISSTSARRLLELTMTASARRTDRW